MAPQHETTVQILPKETVGAVTGLVGDLVDGVLGTKTQSRATQEPDQGKGVTVLLTSEGYQALKELAAERGKSVSEALGDAVRLARLVYKLGQEHGKLLVERDGTVQELLLV
jgi:hypothetical protein